MDLIARKKPVTFIAWIKKVKPEYRSKTIALIREKIGLNDQEYKQLVKGSEIDPDKFDKLRKYTQQNLITY